MEGGYGRLVTLFWQFTFLRWPAASKAKSYMTVSYEVSFYRKKRVGHYRTGTYSNSWHRLQQTHCQTSGCEEVNGGCE